MRVVVGYTGFVRVGQGDELTSGEGDDGAGFYASAFRRRSYVLRAKWFWVPVAALGIAFTGSLLTRGRIWQPFVPALNKYAPALLQDGGHELYAAGTRLYCFTLVRPSSNEVGLMMLQKGRNVGIYACDGNLIISNSYLGHGFEVELVNSDLKCSMGGEFMTALNTEIFMAVWTTVITTAEYKNFDWTVKVDPDCVFFPSRLRIAVMKHKVPVQGAYLINCKFGLHGPLEVFSTEAVNTFAVGSARCVTQLEQLCNGPCPWGEDMFIDQCMSRILRVPRLSDGTLLAEDHCDSKDWQECTSGMVAYHPFKTKAAFTECLDNAAA